MAGLKELKKDIRTKKKRGTNTNQGFLKASHLPDKLKEELKKSNKSKLTKTFLKILEENNIEKKDYDELMVPRYVLTKFFHQYIQLNNLNQKDQNGKISKAIFKPDKTIIRLWNLPNDEIITFKTFQSKMNGMYK